MGTSSFPRDIQLIIDDIILSINEKLGVEFILIGGSFGKASWIYNDLDLISDFELVFISKRKWNILKKKELLIELNSKYPFEISLKGYLLENIQNKIISNYSIKPRNYVNLDFYDTFSSPNILYAKDNESLALKFTPDELPIWEAWRLFINRMAEVISTLRKSDDSLNVSENYKWLKVFESIWDAFLIVNKSYHKNINDRLLLYEKLISEKENDCNLFCLDSRRMIKDALTARREHNLKYFKCDIGLEKRLQIVKNCLIQLESKIILSENLSKSEEFHDAYIMSFETQKKYLEISGFFAITFSNLIRMIKSKSFRRISYPNSILKYSYRHLVLLNIHALVIDLINGSNFNNSRAVLEKLLGKKCVAEISDDNLILEIVKNWKSNR